MTKQELMALIELLNRTLLTQSERLWVTDLFNRELAKFAQPVNQPDNAIP